MVPAWVGILAGDLEDFRKHTLSLADLQVDLRKIRAAFGCASRLARRERLGLGLGFRLRIGSRKSRNAASHFLILIFILILIFLCRGISLPVAREWDNI